MFPQKLRPLLILLLLPLAGLMTLVPACLPPPGPPPTGFPPPGPAPDGYLLCFWNVENLFDDRDDGRRGPGDRTYDPWFAHNPEILNLKLSHLAEAITKLNEGRGPDILALAEVENRRAAELLKDALNQKLGDEALHYHTVLMEEQGAGRHISPAVLTRLPVRAGRTRALGRRLRILETHIVVDHRDLVVVASHWTSRVRRGSEAGRAKYGDQIYGRFKAMYLANPQVDFLVCGDFNDNPDDPSVTQHLRAVGDREAVLNSGGQDPLLLNLFAAQSPPKWPGTHYDRGRWFHFDQIAVSPGLLDDIAWTCDTQSAAVVDTLSRPTDRKHRPWRFGSPHDKHQRGYSDHFPVTVRLRVNPR
jgi:endonuclease/exonuclease/phosphatase family metal-dependent hydrolase